MKIDEMKRRKKELGYTNEMISEYSGIPLGTVQKIFAGITETPRYDTLRELEKVFEKRIDKVGEAETAYIVKHQGEYTVEDYYELPEEKRVELIDGVIYDMSSPILVHQLIIGEIFMQLKSFVKNKKGECMVMTSPLDVQLDCDNKTMVQPDLLIVCERSKMRGRCVYGAPDFVAEVLSKSTKMKDSILKLNKYSDAGVSEYWLVDPNKKKVIVYDFAHDDYPIIYGFDTKVPVGIFGGECKVDFGEIYRYVEFLYE